MLIVTSKAGKDIEKINDWYSKKMLGLDLIFLEHLQFNFSRIAKYPTQYMFIDEEIQRCLMDRFPYKIFFSIVDGDITILRIRHNKQKPLKRFT